MKIVQVTWLDHREENAGGWTAYETARNAQPVECYTVGYLVHQDDERIVVTSTWMNDDDETVGGAFVIVATAVRHLEVIRDDWHGARTSLVDEIARKWRP